MPIHPRRTLLEGTVFFACLAAVAHAQRGGAVPALVYDPQTRGPVPIPPSERSLQTVVAEPWFKVSRQPMVLEGPCFERNGNLLFTDVYGGHVFRLTPDKRISTVVSKNNLGPGASQSTRMGAFSSLPWAVSRELVRSSR